MVLSLNFTSELRLKFFSNYSREVVKGWGWKLPFILSCIKTGLMEIVECLLSSQCHKVLRAVLITPGPISVLPFTYPQNFFFPLFPPWETKLWILCFLCCINVSTDLRTKKWKTFINFHHRVELPSVGVWRSQNSIFDIGFAGS